MAIIIGDIHGDLAMARAFLDYHPHDVHVALGDLVDSRVQCDLEEETACLDLLLHSSAALLWGNHDLAYLPARPWRNYGRFGEAAFRSQYHAHRSRFLAALAVDGWLLTHAGVSPRLSKLMPAVVLKSGVERIAYWLNDRFAEELQTKNPNTVPAVARYGHGPLFQVPSCRGGCDEYGGIFWFDAFGEQTQPAPNVGPQIFGHSPVPYPDRGNCLELIRGEVISGPRWINLNAIEDGVWVYDTERDDIIDVLSGERL